MSNPSQRDSVLGHAGSADATGYVARRQGNLTRQSDGFRTPYVLDQPREPTQRGYRPDPGLAPYVPAPRPPAGAPFPDKPSTHAFLRAPHLGAPHVGLPDERRTSGRLQASGVAWREPGAAPRDTLQPPLDGQDAPPSHTMGQYREGRVSAYGNRWTHPTTPHVYGVQPDGWR